MKRVSVCCWRIFTVRIAYTALRCKIRTIFRSYFAIILYNSSTVVMLEFDGFVVVVCLCGVLFCSNEVTGGTHTSYGIQKRTFWQSSFIFCPARKSTNPTSNNNNNHPLSLSYTPQQHHGGDQYHRHYYYYYYNYR